MKNPNVTYKELVDFVDWLSKQRLELTNRADPNRVNRIIVKARELTGEMPPSDLPQRGNDEPRR